MSANEKRISVFLSEADHARVVQRAFRAGMKPPAYLRRIACGVLPMSKTNDFVTHGIALVANELDGAADLATDKDSREAMRTARDQLRALLRDHLSSESNTQP